MALFFYIRVSLLFIVPDMVQSISSLCLPQIFNGHWTLSLSSSQPELGKRAELDLLRSTGKETRPGSPGFSSKVLGPNFPLSSSMTFVTSKSLPSLLRDISMLWFCLRALVYEHASDCAYPPCVKHHRRPFPCL